jgi:hypothetical protein
MMERAEAFKTLRLDQSADGRMVEHAYWTLVRQAQRRTDDEFEIGHEIDSLNEAYAVLSPDARQAAPQRRGGVPEAGAAFVDRLGDWIAEEALRTRARWAGRNPEVGFIAAAAFVLMILSLGAGASVLATFACALVVFAAVWAPWRRVE